ncbi:MAG TPA: TIGR04282 family arsenosugar biosynthesis glycosyltransferase [Ktedonobacterales bacterium]|nr:TIGR04282 family arsenosugar biosynthesis glycosyltransferase [Ktedonobacterales bacterium]
MPTSASDTLQRDVLAIVAKFPHPGQVKTRLAAGIGAEAAARLYAAFLRDLAARFNPAATREGYALVWAHTPGLGDLRTIVGDGARLLAQRGVDFADRLDGIARDLAGAGYRRTVIASSDSPHLPAARVRDAFAALARADVALGPATDGGYYLVGFHARPAPPDLFRDITMSTPHVLDDTLRRAARLSLRVAPLPATFDVDEPADLLTLARALAAPGPDADPAPRTLAALAELGVTRTREEPASPRWADTGSPRA